MTFAKEALQAERERRIRDILAARAHPANLLRHVRCIDAKTGEVFEFGFDDPEHPWHWQRGMLDWWLTSEAALVLKARQLGITWTACGLALWQALYHPGSRVLAVSINEPEAIKLVNRVWDMWESLPDYLRCSAQVLKPAGKAVRPSTEIQFRFPDGRISAILALPSTPKAGHGETAALVILDEFARQEYARETWKAVVPTIADGKGRTRVLVISTANGVSNELTGDGNYFHHLWVNAGRAYPFLKTEFLSWRNHPDRDQAWYDNLSLPAHDKAEQYPDTPEEAFILSGRLFFDKDALGWYSKNATRREPLYRFDFKKVDGQHAKKLISPEGMIGVFREPEEGREYALAADVATGRGLDQSAAYVVDLGDMALCAEFHGKLDEDLYATQIHYLGRWYNTARLAVETGGGYGNAVIIPLRDGKEGRPPYPKLYRYREETSTAQKERRNFGFPMTTVTRPLVISGLEKALRERSLPWVTQDLMNELRTFVHKNTNPSPRAEDGTNDDCVMAAAIALEMYRRFGHHPDKPKRKKRRPYQHWLPLGRDDVRQAA